jgi:diguanylate cyclase (GGDEF)-like protein
MEDTMATPIATSSGSDIGGMVRIAAVLLERLGADDLRVTALDLLHETYHGTTWVLIERADVARYDVHTCGRVNEDNAREICRLICRPETSIVVHGADPGAFSFAERARVCSWPTASGEPLVALGLWTDPGAAGPTDAELLLATHLLASVVSSARAISILQQRVSIDEQTGILNRAGILETLERERARACRYGRQLSVMYVDLDGLKHINDTFGHTAGDQLIVALVRAVIGSLRSSDAIGRLGGDEFLVILPEADVDGARAVAERLRSTLANVHVPIGDATLSPVASIGCATLGETGVSDLVDTADKRMFEAKRQNSKTRASQKRATRPLVRTPTRAITG